MDTHSLALLILRLGLGYFFVDAARVHTLLPRGRERTFHFTAVLLRQEQAAAYSPLVKQVSVLAMMLLWFGGLGVLLGILTGLSAAGILIFAACGYVIHMRELKLAGMAAKRLGSMMPPEAAPAIRPLLESALTGNAGAGLKNIVIICAAALLILEGPGAYSLSALLARV